MVWQKKVKRDSATQSLLGGQGDHKKGSDFFIYEYDFREESFLFV